MPFALRKIRKAKWYRNDPRLSWLQKGELQADSIGDIVTKSNKLSVYFIEADLSNFNRVVAALAVTSDALSNFDCALIDASLLTQANFKFEGTPGDTPDNQVNSWHQDIIELSARQLWKLANLIQNHSRIERVLEKQVGQFIVEGVKNGYIERNRIRIKSEKFLNVLDKISP